MQPLGQGGMIHVRVGQAGNTSSVAVGTNLTRECLNGPNQTLTTPLGAAMRLLLSGRAYDRATDNLLAFLLRGM